MKLILGEGICQNFRENWDLQISRNFKVTFRRNSKKREKRIKLLSKRVFASAIKGLVTLY